MPSAASFISHNSGQRFQQVNYYDCLSGQALRKAKKIPHNVSAPVVPSSSTMLKWFTCPFLKAITCCHIFFTSVYMCRPKDAIRAMKKRLNGNRNYREVMLALTVSTKGAWCNAKIISLMASVLLYPHPLAWISLTVKIKNHSISL